MVVRVIHGIVVVEHVLSYPVSAGDEQRSPERERERERERVDGVLVSVRGANLASRRSSRACHTTIIEHTLPTTPLVKDTNL